MRFMPRKTPDLTDMRFGRLTALARDYSKSGHAFWRCRCDCGKDAIVASVSLRNGNTRSCGCLQREVTVARSTTHGLSGTPTYYSWINMIRRTTHENDPRYPGWGGRGIKVCDRWREYPNFLADMGERPPGTTLERVDNDGDYKKENCTWATPLQQFQNTRLQRDPVTGRWASP
jgi:hypothetical protein